MPSVLDILLLPVHGIILLANALLAAILLIPTICGIILIWYCTALDFPFREGELPVTDVRCLAKALREAAEVWESVDLNNELKKERKK